MRYSKHKIDYLYEVKQKISKWQNICYLLQLSFVSIGLKGERGEKGDKGDLGFDGSPGAAGPPGLVGLKGKK